MAWRALGLARLGHALAEADAARSKLAGWVSIVSGLVMSACCSAHLVLMLPIGVGMLLCSPAQGRPCYTASGWWVGTATKLLAVEVVY
jgi:hypothetical protein